MRVIINVSIFHSRYLPTVILFVLYACLSQWRLFVFRWQEARIPATSIGLVDSLSVPTPIDRCTNGARSWHGVLLALSDRCRALRVRTASSCTHSIVSVIYQDARVLSHLRPTNCYWSDTVGVMHTEYMG